MSVDDNIQVTDAREYFIRWNKVQLENILAYSDDDTSKYLKLIPLFLQLNHKLLPGYTGQDVPVGVYSYKADKSSINDAQSLNSKFRYKHEGVIKNSAIDAVILQRRIIDASLCCWIFSRSSLSKEQLYALENKIKKISQWFSGKGLELEFYCLSDKDFVNNKKNKALFLDEFYSEIMLLAGKYPVWWLVPPSKEAEYASFVEHIKQARFVNNDEFIDLGSTAGLIQEDLIEFAVDQVKTIKQSAEICLIQLLIADQKNRAWPKLDGVSFRLKKTLYQRNINISSLEIMIDILRESFSQYASNKHIYTADKLFLKLRNIPGKLNLEIIEAFIGDNNYREEKLTGIDNILSSLNYFKAIADEIRQLFTHIVARYIQHSDVSGSDQALISVAKNMKIFLSDRSNHVPLYNSKSSAEIIFDRILLRHHSVSQSDQYVEPGWSLVLKASAGDEKTIDGFNSLLSLLAWCWLNRVVNHSTQISIDYPSHQIKQIDARHVLEILMQQLDPKTLIEIPSNSFERPVQPLKSLLFLSVIDNEDDAEGEAAVSGDDDSLAFTHQPETQVLHCEQLIINSWGDVYTRSYSGYEGVLQCLCEWTHHVPQGELAKLQTILAFSYGAGDSTYLAQRVDQIYAEFILFFYKEKKQNVRFVLRMGNTYYIILFDNVLLQVREIGGLKSLLEYLEAPAENWQDTALERLAFTEQPLREIYQRNKQNVLQVFFQLINRRYHIWVLDERGTLWTDVVDVFDRESYIIHWLYLFRNIQNRLKNISYQDHELPTFEISQISINQLGGFSFYTKGADAFTEDKVFFELQLIIDSSGNEDQLSLICEGRKFLYKEFKQNALMECVQYLLEKRKKEGYRSVFVTDIDAPLSLYNVDKPEDMQINHILKFKRNFEHRINKMLEG